MDNSFEISREDALALVKLYAAARRVPENVMIQLEDLMTQIDSFILNSEDEEDEEDKCDVMKKSEHAVSSHEVLDLPAIRATDITHRWEMPQSRRIVFDYFQGRIDLIDADEDSDDQQFFIENIVKVMRSGTTLRVTTALGTEHVFTVNRFPPSWTALFDLRCHQRIHISTSVEQ